MVDSQEGMEARGTCRFKISCFRPLHVSASDLDGVPHENN